MKKESTAKKKKLYSSFLIAFMVSDKTPKNVTVCRNK